MVPISGEEAGKVARKFKLGLPEAAALRSLSDDVESAEKLAKAFSEDADAAAAESEADRVANEVYGSGGIGGKI